MTPIQLDDHQVEGAEELFHILKENGLVYCEWEERTRKTMTVMEMLRKTIFKQVLWITKKKPLPDLDSQWQAYSNSYSPGYQLTTINYESLHKLSLKNYDCIILDEAHHAMATYPKKSKTWDKVKVLTKGKPVVYMSATPYPETLAQIYHQFALSDWSPFWEYTSFYKWHEQFGLPYLEYIGARQIKKYDKVQDDRILRIIKPLFSKKTRSEVGFKHEPTDEVHYVTLGAQTEQHYKEMSKDFVTVIGEEEVVAETSVAVLQKLAQLVGGTMKVEDPERATEKKMAYRSFWTGNTEKIDYIKKTWGDTDDMVIMYHYKEEEHLLKHHFKKARILQADTWAEGVSLKEYEHLIVYSMSWRTSKYIQRRARQADKEREESIEVKYVLSHKVDEYIYEAVALKRVNFNGRYFYGEHPSRRHK